MQLVFKPDQVPTKKGEADWLMSARQKGFVACTCGNSMSVLVGDPWDSIPLMLEQMRWGMPNPWMGARGLDEWDGAVASMTTEQAFGGSQKWTFGLVPVTMVDSTNHPFARMITLACAWRSHSVDHGHYGFAIIGEGACLTMVEPHHHDEWMSGWTKCDGRRRLTTAWDLPLL